MKELHESADTRLTVMVALFDRSNSVLINAAEDLPVDHEPTECQQSHINKVIHANFFAFRKIVELLMEDDDFDQTEQADQVATFVVGADKIRVAQLQQLAPEIDFEDFCNDSELADSYQRSLSDDVLEDLSNEEPADVIAEDQMKIYANDLLVDLTTLRPNLELPEHLKAYLAP